ncbi:hypothetical protein CHEID_08595 [Corynebacterium heidelbergense]|nr:hypothetical protein CHEID_08595 [Corynebacterium heidelbergense]
MRRFQGLWPAIFRDLCIGCLNFLPTAIAATAVNARCRPNNRPHPILTGATAALTSISGSTLTAQLDRPLARRQGTRVPHGGLATATALTGPALAGMLTSLIAGRTRNSAARGAVVGLFGSLPLTLLAKPWNPPMHTDEELAELATEFGRATRRLAKEHRAEVAEKYREHTRRKLRSNYAKLRPENRPYFPPRYLESTDADGDVLG